MTHHHRQRMTFVSDGEARSVSAEFTWHCFRYIELQGDAEIEQVKMIYADVPVTSTFACDNETLNWICKTFIHTMHCNMHSVTDLPFRKRDFRGQQFETF